MLTDQTAVTGCNQIGCTPSGLGHNPFFRPFLWPFLRPFLRPIHEPTSWRSRGRSQAACVPPSSSLYCARMADRNRWSLLRTPGAPMANSWAIPDRDWPSTQAR